jgi:hypothetical protein
MERPGSGSGCPSSGPGDLGDGDHVIRPSFCADPLSLSDHFASTCDGVDMPPGVGKLYHGTTSPRHQWVSSRSRHGLGTHAPIITHLISSHRSPSVHSIAPVRGQRRWLIRTVVHRASVRRITSACKTNHLCRHDRPSYRVPNSIPICIKRGSVRYMT